MKIKIREKSYEDVLAQPVGAHKSPMKQLFPFRLLLKLLSIPDLKATHFTYHEIGMDKRSKGEPCLYLMNHSSFIDLKIAATIIYPHSFHVVCTSDGFVGKDRLMRLIGCIPTKKFVTDMALISQASGIANEAGPGREAGTIATVVGLISVFNGLGRVFFGNLFDKKGRRVTMAVVGIGFSLSAAVLAAALGLKAFPLIIVGFVCCGFSYGGLNPTISAFVNAAYGPSHYPMNFSVMNLNLLAASFGGTIAGMLFDASGSYMTTCMYMIGSGIVSLVFAGVIRKV